MTGIVKKVISLSIMKHFFVTLLVLAFWFPGYAQEVDSLALFDPNDVFVVEENLEQQQRLEANKMVAGKWQYSKPYVHAQGATLIGKLGKPIAKSKLKKELGKAYKKMKINKRWSSLTLSEDGMWDMRVLGLSFNGHYTYDSEQELLTLRWHGIPLKSHIHRDGKKLYVAFDMDHLLVILHVVSGISNSDTLKSLSFLSENFRDVMVGFEMKPVK